MIYGIKYRPNDATISVWWWETNPDNIFTYVDLNAAHRYCQELSVIHRLSGIFWVEEYPSAAF